MSYLPSIAGMVFTVYSADFNALSLETSLICASGWIFVLMFFFSDRFVSQISMCNWDLDIWIHQIALFQIASLPTQSTLKGQFSTKLLGCKFIPILTYEYGKFERIGCL